MNLTRELQDLRDTLRANHPSNVKATMDAATENLARSGMGDRVLKRGKAPNFTLPNATGETVELYDLLARGPVVLSFYRGGWCPYCNLELRGLQTYLSQIQDKGATLVAVSPETPDNSLSTREKNELEFQVLSDARNNVARQFGLVFTLPEELRPIYSQFGIDIPAYNGDDSFELPLPATYVIAPNGDIVLAFAEADYTQRLDPDAVIAALDRLPAVV